MNKNRFLDVRTHGFVRVGAAVPKVVVANPEQNAHNHIAVFQRLYEEGVHYGCAPELGLSGYSCGDLFFSQTLIEEVEKAVNAVIAASLVWPGMVLTVGAPLCKNNKLFNCAVTICQGRVIAIAPKSYLPNYREFYEERHFADASAADSFKTLSKIVENVPFGNEILIEVRPKYGKSFVVHTEICEDLWVPIPPSAKAALAGATILANLSASNITVDKNAYRQDLVLGSSARNNAVQLYVSAGHGESTTDLAWDGAAMIAERGQMIMEAIRFQTKSHYILADVDIEVLEMERVKQNSFAKNAQNNVLELRRIVVDLVQDKRAEVYQGEILRPIERQPFVPSQSAKRDERCQEVINIQTMALITRLEALPANNRKVVIGISGGLDSLLSLLIARNAMKELGLPMSNIIAITMPGFGTTVGTQANAEELIQLIGATYRVEPIKDIAMDLLESAGYLSDQDGENLAFENSQAWARMMVELTNAAQNKAIVLGTGDMSELALGWCTMFGDHASHYNVNAGVPKTLVIHLIKWVAKKKTTGPKLKAVIERILATRISPELKSPGAEGQIVQSTEEVIGPYILHDFFLEKFVRFGFRPTKIARLALDAFEDDFSLAEITKWLKVFIERFCHSQFKRSCLPDGPKVGLVCLSPRGDWRMPSDIAPDIWLKDLEQVPGT